MKRRSAVTTRWARPAALALATLACGPDPETVLGGRIVGEWHWIATTGGLTGETRTDPNHRWRLALDRDGAVREDYAGRPSATGLYELESAPGAGTPGVSSVTLKLSGAQLVMVHDQPFALTLRGDTLLFGSSVYDGLSYVFVRAEAP